LTGCLDCPERRDTEVRWDPSDRPVPQERTAREARTERSDQGDWLERAVPVVCWDLEVHPDPLDSLVSLEWTALTVPKETWGHKESQGHPDSRVSRGHRVFLDLKGPSDLPEKRDLTAGRDWPAYLEQTVLPVTQAKRGPLERKEP